MENENTLGGAGLLLTILIVGAIILWNQNSDLKKKVTAYQTCISYYQDQEQKFKTAIDDATNYLDQGGSYDYRNAQDSLNIDTTPLDCSSITDFPIPTP